MSRLVVPLGLALLLAMAAPASADSYFAFTGTIHVGSPRNGGINSNGLGRQTLRNLSLGLDFDVESHGITITHLGLWDDNGDGLASFHSLSVYDTNGQTILATTDTDAAGSFLHEGYRYFPLTSGLDIGIGDLFTVVVYYPTNNGDSNGNSGRTDQGLEPTPIFHDGGGAIINVNGGRFGFGDSFPTHNDTGPANRYHAGSFAYTVNSAFNSTAAAVTSYTTNPEPGTLALMATALGGVGLVVLRRRRRRVA